MEGISKVFQALSFDNGQIRIISSDHQQMARWYALGYLKEKPCLTDKGVYVGEVSEGFYFTPTFRKKQQ